MKKIEITASEKDKVLNLVSKNIPEISFAYANKLLRQKDIRVDNKKVGDNVMVQPDSVITVFVPDDVMAKQGIAFDIVYSDDKLLIVFKPKGIEVTGEGFNFSNLVCKKLENKNIFALNRLDRNTEGLVLFAVGKDNYNNIKKSMNKGEITKVYMAEVVGVPKWDELTAVNYLQKDEEKSEVKIFDKPVKNSVKIESHFMVVSRTSGGTSILAIEIKNGKTHQIRAQLAHLGFAIVGDGKYGKNADNKKFKSKTQKLTAIRLKFAFKDASLRYLNNKDIEVKPTWLKM